MTMPVRIIPVITHLGAATKLDIEALRMVLEEIVSAIYGENATLELGVGSVGIDPTENFLHILAPLNAGIGNDCKAVLAARLGEPIELGYSSSDADHSEKVLLDTASESLKNIARAKPKVQ